MQDEAALAAVLSELGFDARPSSAGGLRTIVRTPDGDVSIRFRHEGAWVNLSIAPFLSTHGNNSFELARWLLRQNREMYQVKFAYEPEGDVCLALELPTEALDPGEVLVAVDSLVRYCLEHRATLRSASGA